MSLQKKILYEERGVHQKKGKKKKEMINKKKWWSRTYRVKVMSGRGRLLEMRWENTRVTRQKFRFPLQFSFRSVWNLSASSQWPTPYTKIKTSTRHNLQAALGSENYKHDFRKNTSRKLLGDISSPREPWARWRVLILLVDVWTQPSPPWDWPLAPETGLENNLLPIFRQPSLSLELFSLRHAQRKKLFIGKGN